VLVATHSAEAAAIADVRVRLRDGRVVLIESTIESTTDSAIYRATDSAIDRP
jgi:ABC-type lipoprotein export system ATPase subunit